MTAFYVCAGPSSVYTDACASYVACRMVNHARRRVEVPLPGADEILRRQFIENEHSARLEPVPIPRPHVKNERPKPAPLVFFPRVREEAWFAAVSPRGLIRCLGNVRACPPPSIPVHIRGAPLQAVKLHAYGCLPLPRPAAIYLAMAIRRRAASAKASGWQRPDHAALATTNEECSAL